MSVFVYVNDATFDQDVLKSSLSVRVEFGAEWCVPCRQMEPLFEQLAAEWQGKRRMAKVNMDESAKIAIQYQVMGVPTLILFINGEIRQQLSGKQARDRLIEKFSPFL